MKKAAPCSRSSSPPPRRLQRHFYEAAAGSAVYQFDAETSTEASVLGSEFPERGEAARQSRATLAERASSWRGEATAALETSSQSGSSRTATFLRLPTEPCRERLFLGSQQSALLWQGRRSGHPPRAASEYVSEEAAALLRVKGWSAGEASGSCRSLLSSGEEPRPSAVCLGEGAGVACLEERFRGLSQKTVFLAVVTLAFAALIGAWDFLTASYVLLLLLHLPAALKTSSLCGRRRRVLWALALNAAVTCLALPVSIAFLFRLLHSDYLPTALPLAHGDGRSQAETPSVLAGVSPAPVVLKPKPALQTERLGENNAKENSPTNHGLVGAAAGTRERQQRFSSEEARGALPEGKETPEESLSADAKAEEEKAGGGLGAEAKKQQSGQDALPRDPPLGVQTPAQPQAPPEESATEEDPKTSTVTPHRAQQSAPAETKTRQERPPSSPPAAQAEPDLSSRGGVQWVVLGLLVGLATSPVLAVLLLWMPSSQVLSEFAAHSGDPEADELRCEASRPREGECTSTLNVALQEGLLFSRSAV